MKTTFQNQAQSELSLQTFPPKAENIVHPGKPLGYSLYAPLALLGFILQATVPSLAMDAKEEKEETAPQRQFAQTKFQPGARPQLRGADYGSWMREIGEWVSRQQGSRNEGVSFSSLTPEFSFTTTVAKTTLRVRMLLKTPGLEDVDVGDFFLGNNATIDHSPVANSPENRPIIIRHGHFLHTPEISWREYKREAIPGLSSIQGLQALAADSPARGKEEIVNKPIGNVTYGFTMETQDMDSDELFERDGSGKFICSARPSFIESPYLYGLESTDTLHLTRTMKAFHHRETESFIQYTVPTPLSVKVRISEERQPETPEMYPSGVFEKQGDWWVRFNDNTYTPNLQAAQYKFEIQEINVPGGVKKTQFLFDIHHAAQNEESIRDLLRAKLVLSSPFAPEQVGEFAAQGAAPALPNFTTLDSAFYPPFAFPASLVNLTLRGTTLAHLSLSTAQARAVGSLNNLTALSLVNVDITDADLVLALRQNLRKITLKGVPTFGEATVARLVTLRTQNTLQDLTVSDGFRLAALFNARPANPRETQAMGPLLGRNINSGALGRLAANLRRNPSTPLITF